MAGKRRADQLLVEHGLAESRTRAQALILAGLVIPPGGASTSPASRSPDAILALEVRDHPWVSRGGIKLAHALDHFGIAVEGAALDIGASTGGFTDVLLARGAGVSTPSMSATASSPGSCGRIRASSCSSGPTRVFLTRADIPEPVDLVVCDASFIGLATVLPAPLALVRRARRLVALIKPQFEAGRGESARAAWCAIPRSIARSASAPRPGSPASPAGPSSASSTARSPARRGNREFLLYARRGGEDAR